MPVFLLRLHPGEYSLSEAGFYVLVLPQMIRVRQRPRVGGHHLRNAFNENVLFLGRHARRQDRFDLR